jgi:hypothetical protein
MRKICNQAKEVDKNRKDIRQDDTICCGGRKNIQQTEKGTRRENVKEGKLDKAGTMIMSLPHVVKVNFESNIVKEKGIFIVKPSL